MKKISLFREKNFVFSFLEKNQSLQKKACQVLVGFSASIDPLSGMTVNLRDIDTWFDQIEEDLKQNTFLNWCELHHRLETWWRLNLPASVELRRIEIKYALGKKIISGLGKNIFYREISEDFHQAEPVEKTLSYQIVDAKDEMNVGEPTDIQIYFRKSGVKLSGKSSENL